MIPVGRGINMLPVCQNTSNHPMVEHSLTDQVGALTALVADVKAPYFKTSASPTFGSGPNSGAYESLRFIAQYSQRGRSHES